jgi:hypothetical protein
VQRLICRPLSQIIEKIDESSLNHPKYWLPLVWAGSIVTRARKENRIKDDFAMKALIERIDTYRSLCGGLLNYDWINIPLVYTQVSFSCFVSIISFFDAYRV